MIDAIVELQNLLHEHRLIGIAGDTDDARAGPFGDLARDRADRAGGGGDQHRFAGFRLADILHCRIGRGAGHAENAEIGGERDVAAMCGRQRHQLVAMGHEVACPAPGILDDLARREARILGGNDLANSLAGHHSADLDRWGVGWAVAQPATHIRIE